MFYNERLNWHYVPKPREGVAIKELADIPLNAGAQLLSHSLSASGFEKSRNIIELEDILRIVEGDNEPPFYRDAGKYFYTIFGLPHSESPWGWRLEGHHLSLNFTVMNGVLISSTPAFMGANPANVSLSSRKGWRVLKEEEDLARKLLQQLDNKQLSKAIVSKTAPRDIITGALKYIKLQKPEGIAATELSVKQTQLLTDLINIYLNNFKEEFAEHKRK
jgi:hypothetical protein